jgi:hypothetical protein
MAYEIKLDWLMVFVCSINYLIVLERLKKSQMAGMWVYDCKYEWLWINSTLIESYRWHETIRRHISGVGSSEQLVNEVRNIDGVFDLCLNTILPLLSSVSSIRYFSVYLLLLYWSLKGLVVLCCAGHRTSRRITGWSFTWRWSVMSW